MATAWPVFALSHKIEISLEDFSTFFSNAFFSTANKSVKNLISNWKELRKVWSKKKNF